MSEEVVEDAMQDLDAFSLERETLQWSFQCRRVLEKDNFWDLSKVILDAFANVKDSEPLQQQLLDDIYEGIMDLAMTEVAI